MEGASLKRLITSSVVLLGTAGEVMGQDKGQYSLFNPTPDRSLRGMTTDRPDTTESPFTVDAGRVQMEIHVLGYTHSRPDSDGAIVGTHELATTNVRLGLTSNAEINLVWQPYGIVRTRQANPAATLQDAGIGGLDLRAKFNLWGNDTFEKTGTALSLLPYITLPTDRHNGISPEFVEGGLIVPYAMKLSEKFGLGLNAGVTWVRSDAESRYHPEYMASASLSYEWSEKLGTYYEVAAQLNSDDPRGDAVVVGTGVTYKLGKNVQLDAGINFGITPAADRVNPFLGLSTRF